MTMTNGVAITVTGLDQLKKELGILAPDLKNQLTKVFRNAAKDVRDDARHKIGDISPLRGWKSVPPKKPRSRGGAGFPIWNAARAAKGIDYKAGVTAPGFSGSGRSSAKFFGYRVYNASPVGNILESARKSHRKSSETFIQGLAAHYGHAGRLIYSAYDKRHHQIDQAIGSEVERIVSEYDKRINDLK